MINDFFKWCSSLDKYSVIIICLVILLIICIVIGIIVNKDEKSEQIDDISNKSGDGKKINTLILPETEFSIEYELTIVNSDEII